MKEEPNLLILPQVNKVMNTF